MCTSCSFHVDIDKKDKKGRTALSYACSYGFEELAAILIGDDDDIKANPKIADVNGRTPLMYAAEFGKVECVSLLVDELSIQDINRSDNNGLTALHLACLNGHKDCVDFLVQSNASITAVDKEGRNAMHAVCLGGHLPCLEFLLSKNSRIGKQHSNIIASDLHHVTCSEGND
jgi:ankyrin repeat protein